MHLYTEMKSEENILEVMQTQQLGSQQAKVNYHGFPAK